MKRVRAKLLALAAAAALLGASCSSAPKAPLTTTAGLSGTPGVVGASIAVVAGGSRVAVVNPDQGSVSFLDPSTLAVKTTTPVGGEPHALVEARVDGEDSVLVANFRGGDVVVLDASSGAAGTSVHVCDGAYGLAGSPDGTWVAVSCEWDGSVVKLDLATMSVEATPLASGLHRPRAVAVVGSTLYVADYIGGLVHAVPLAGGAATTWSLVPSSAPYRPALAQMTANLTSALLPAFGALYASYVLENNTGDTTLEAEAEDYGSVTNTNPKINPAVSAYGGSSPVTYAAYDGGARVYSGPSAMASFGSRYLLVAHVSTANVAVVDTEATTSDTRSVGTFQVGFGPSGIAVDEASSVAYVDNALDGSVSVIDLSGSFAAPAASFAATTTLVRDLPSSYSQDALAGRRLFFDATNPHVTPSGVVACASCHPGGGDDGLVWFIHTDDIPLKRRRSPHLGNAKSETAPFHWNGQYATMSDLVESTITDLMAGDGLLIDVTTVQPFIDEVVEPPVLPVTDAASVARGQVLFESQSLGCATCHDGSYFTDDKLHTVLDPMSLSSDDVITASNTPGLHGVFLMAPYFHDGRAATLTDVLTIPSAAPNEHTTGLSPGQLTDLVNYLASL